MGSFSLTQPVSGPWPDSVGTWQGPHGSGSRGIPSSQTITEIHTAVAPLTQGSAGNWWKENLHVDHLHLICRLCRPQFCHMCGICLHMCPTSPGINLPVQYDPARMRMWVRVGKLRQRGRCHQHLQRNTGTQFPVPRTTMAFAQNISGCPEALVMGMIQGQCRGWGDGSPGPGATFCPQLGPEMSLRNPPAC